MGPVGGDFKPVSGEFKRVRGPVFATGRVRDADRQGGELSRSWVALWTSQGNHRPCMRRFTATCSSKLPAVPIVA